MYLSFNNHTPYDILNKNNLFNNKIEMIVSASYFVLALFDLSF